MLQHFQLSPEKDLAQSGPTQVLCLMLTPDGRKPPSAILTLHGTCGRSVHELSLPAPAPSTCFLQPETCLEGALWGNSRLQRAARWAASSATTPA